MLKMRRQIARVEIKAYFQSDSSLLLPSVKLSLFRRSRHFQHHFDIDIHFSGRNQVLTVKCSRGFLYHGMKGNGNRGIRLTRIIIIPSVL